MPYVRRAAAILCLASLAACSDRSSTSSIDTGAVPASLQAISSIPGTVNAAAGSAGSTILVTFAGSDTQPLQNLSVSGLGALPAGWSTPSGSFSCASVTSGNGCVLELTYAPSSVATGILTLTYTYQDSTGTSQSGTLTLNYQGTQADNVIANVSPTGQVIAPQGGSSQPVTVNFNADEGVASGLSLTSDLGTLPAGWSASASNFSCTQVESGSGCQLSLQYTPTAGSGGTLTLNYTYTDNTGASRTGAVAIPYATTTQDAVTASYAPAGQVSGVIGGSGQPVTVTFASNDGRNGSDLTVTSNLAALPPGWSSSSASGFQCSSVASTGCQLMLTYAPQSSGQGTLQLIYQYVSGDGASRQGVVAIPYEATTNDNVLASINPSGTVTVAAGSSQAVDVTFTTDDGNTATGLVLTSALSSLPSGWSSASSSFSCALVNTGAGCELALSYAPSAPDSGTLTLGYSYVDNAGTSKSGTLNINYVGTSLHAYVVDPPSVYLCSLTGSGELSGCASTGSGFSLPEAIAFSGSYAYVADGNGAGSIIQCNVATDGTLTGCATALSGGFNGDPGYLLSANGLLYIPQTNLFGGPEYCTIGSGGALSDCTSTNAAGGSNQATGIALLGSNAYVSTVGDQSQPGILVCAYGDSGSLSGCADAGSGLGGASNVLAAGNLVYSLSGTNVLACVPSTSGTLSGCVSSTPVSPPAGDAVMLRGGLAMQNATLYVPYMLRNMGNPRASPVAGVEVCLVDSQGNLSGCADSGATFSNPLDVAIH